MDAAASEWRHPTCALSARDLQEIMADSGKHIAMGTGQGFSILAEDELRRYLDGGIPAMIPDGYATNADVVRTEDRVVLVVAMGTGIGGALVLDGALFRGATGVAGETGHIPVTRKGPVCACGSRGCLETYAAGPRIAAAYARATGAGERMDLPEVVARARAGDGAARAAFRRAGTSLGLVLAGLVNTINPDVVVVGGGVAEAGLLLWTPLRHTLDRHLLGPARAAVTVAPAALGMEAGLVGAALLARRPTMSVPVP